MAKKVVKKRRAKSVVRREKARSERGKNLVPHRFKKGNPGKKKGTKNKIGVRLKECILEAAEQSGRDGKGTDGAVGYLVWLSRAEPAVFGRMLEKIMPLQIDVKDKTERSLTAAEAVEKLEERGLPVPPALRSLAEGIGRAVAERQERDYDDELNGTGYEGADDGFVEPGGEGEDRDGSDEEEPEDGGSDPGSSERDAA